MPSPRPLESRRNLLTFPALHARLNANFTEGFRVTQTAPRQPGDSATIDVLKKSEATARLKAKYVLATDGQTIAADRLRDGETLACDYKDLPNHFGILLDLAGISTTPRIDENTFDIRATNKLNKLYV